MLVSEDRRTVQMIIAQEEFPDGFLAWKIEKEQHRLVRDESGRVDMFAYADVDDATGESHHGPCCEQCGKVWCEDCSQGEVVFQCEPDDESSLADELD